MPELRITDSYGTETKSISFSLSEIPFTIGRGQDNAFSIDDECVSDRHFKISLDSEKLAIVDLDSGTGTFVNGDRISCTNLNHGDLIRVGNTLLILDDQQHGDFPDRVAEKWGDREQMAVVGETTALMSHQINNVIQGINGGAYLIDVGLSKGDLDTVTRGWEIVSANQKELTEVFSGLLNLGKPFDPEMQRVDLVGILRDSLDDLSSFLTSEGASVQIDEPPCQFHVDGDEKGLTLSLKNLFRIAVRASRSDSPVVLEIGFIRMDGAISIQVLYRGAAICLDPAATLNPIDRDRWFIAGIDFAVSRKIIMAHQGDIKLSDRGDGSHQISVDLPLSRNHKT